MIPLNDWLLFTGAALLMVLTPGPNMVYLVSRSLCQGQAAGVVSLMGVVCGLSVHLCAAAWGLSALFLKLPLAYSVLKWMGAAYLAWLAWQALKPGARSPFEARALPVDTPYKLWLMGLLTSLLNPKVVVFYLSVLPQFIAPLRGSVFWQSITLGLTQISVSFCVNLSLALSAARIAAWLAGNPRWLAAQRRMMGGVLAALALRLAFDDKRV
jgi:threonine/homoserine/homoserine lactone efflux protein